MTSQPPAPPAPAQPEGTAVKPIGTYPPLPVLKGEFPVSERTGEPPRSWSVTVALVLSCLASVAVAVTYSRHWWLAAHPETYATSAYLIQWLTPEPGKALSLGLEGVLAGVAVLAGGATAVAGFQAWNGWAWSRIAAVAALVLTGAATVLLSMWGLAAVALAALALIALLLPNSRQFFANFQAQRASQSTVYRRPAHIFYGRLPRFR